MNIEQKLDEVILMDLNGLKEIELGTDTYKVTVDGVTKLIEKKTDLARLEMEFQEKENARENDNYFKMKQLEKDSIDKKVNYGIAVFGIVTPLLVNRWFEYLMANASWRFEEFGTVTSSAGKEFTKRLFSKK